MSFSAILFYAVFVVVFIERSMSLNCCLGSHADYDDNDDDNDDVS